MAKRGLELWERFASDTGEGSGVNRCGLFYLSNDEEEIGRWAPFCQDSRRDHVHAQRQGSH